MMQINFDNLRSITLNDYNDLVKLLNCSICTDEDMNRVVVPVSDVVKILDKLRLDMVLLMSLVDPSIPDCNELKNITVLEFKDIE